MSNERVLSITIESIPHFYNVHQTSISIKIGDRVELISWKDTMSKATSGSQGTVVEIDSNQDLIWVQWDTGENLALLKDIDKFKKVEK